MFSPYKSKLRELLSRRCVDNQTSRYSVAEFVSIVVRASQSVIVKRDWSTTFQRCGFGRTEDPESNSVVDIKTKLDIPNGIQPNLDEVVLTTCLPLNRQLPLEAFHPGFSSTIPMLQAMFPFSETRAACPAARWRRELSEA